MPKKLSVRDLSEIIGAKCSIDDADKISVNRVLTQSVYVKDGDAVIAAKWYDVTKTIDEALERGACAVFCEEQYAVKYSDRRVLAVKNPLECVEKFEKWCEQKCDAKRITITGSVGKTTTTGLINQVIANTYNTLTHHTMANSHGAILRNFQQLTPKHEFWVQEVGGVQPGYIESSAYMLHPDAVVLTNIGTSHLDKYKTQEGIFRDKSSLERYAKYDGVVIINKDDNILKSQVYNHKVITFAIDDKSADYYADNIITDYNGTHFELVCSEGRFLVSLNLFGKYNAYNALAAVAVGRWANIPMNRIIALLSEYEPSGMRQNMQNIGGFRFLVDCFNAEPRTVLGSAETLSEMVPGNGGRKIFISGHIDKIGDASTEMHAELGHKLSKLGIDIMVFFAGDSKYTYEALKEDGYENAYFMDSRDELDDWIRQNIKYEDIVFYKSGQFEAALAKTIDHVYGTTFQNEQQFNEGTVRKKDKYSFRLRQDDIVELCGYEGSEKKLLIPTEYEGKPVLRIGAKVFTHMRNVRSAILPDSIVNIGREAFYVCDKLETIVLPKNLKIIGRSAFNFCRSLKQIELPEGLLHIEMRAFRDCVLLERIIVPDSVGFIGEEAFKSCEKLTIVCSKGSYAEKYAKENKINLEYC